MCEKYSMILIAGGLSMSAISCYLYTQNNNKGKKIAIGSFIAGSLTIVAGIIMYFRN